MRWTQRARREGEGVTWNMACRRARLSPLLAALYAHVEWSFTWIVGLREVSARSRSG